MQITKISNSQIRQVTNWSDSVSNYMDKRRQQTQAAYNITSPVESSPLSQSKDNIQDESLFNTIFKSLLIILGQELEAGHTVIELMEHHDECSVSQLSDDKTANIKDSVKNDTVVIQSQSPSQLYQWQQALINLLLQPWQGIVVSKKNGCDFDLLELVTNPEIAANVFQSVRLSRSEALLNKRRDLATRLYQYFTHDDRPVSLKDFRVLLTKHALFFDRSSSKNNQLADTPIVFEMFSKLQSSVNSDIIDTTNINNKHSSRLVLWLHRSWFAEWSISHHIKRIRDNTPESLSLDKFLNKSSLTEEQKQAVQCANRSAFSIITGGPGTGKTYTVAQLVIALYQSHQPSDDINQSNESDETGGDKKIPVKHKTKTPLSLVLSAPTGKAAQRMQESIQKAIQTCDIDLEIPEAKTIHRLLGIGATGAPRYNADNPVSADIIIIDEASMLGVELANHLLSAVKSGARLILLGDANQLAAVDAGSVLADLCKLPVLADIHQQLTISTRFTDDSSVGKLAALINDDAVTTHTISDITTDTKNDIKNIQQKKLKLTQLLSKEPALHFNELQSNLANSYAVINQAKQHYKSYFNQSKLILDSLQSLDKRSHQSGKSIDLLPMCTLLMSDFNKFRILTAGHLGVLGDGELNQQLATYHKALLKLPLSNSDWYHGRPIMVSKNNYQERLFNGDIGLCIQTEMGLKVFFDHKAELIPVTVLNEAELNTAYAMTIHKSQGSEFDHVAIMLDESSERMLSRELIYTAVTRAKSNISIFSTLAVLHKSVLSPTARLTGLALQFNNDNDNTHDS